jgi:hypothetical protein
MSSPRVTYVPRPDAAPEAELDALASVFRFVLDCGDAHRADAMKKATRPGSPDDAEGTRIAKGGAM